MVLRRAGRRGKIVRREADVVGGGCGTLTQRARQQGAVAPALARALAVILLTGCSTAKCCGSLVRALVRWVDLVGWLIGWLVGLVGVCVRA